MMNVSIQASELFGGLATLLLYSAYLRSRRVPSIEPVMPRSLETNVASGAAASVKRAKTQHKMSLDYSMESIDRVEQVLDRLHQQYEIAPQSIDVHASAFDFGSYIGETLRRNTPNCTWEQHHDAGGSQSYLLHMGNDLCFPVEWCLKRIVDGKADDLRSEQGLSRTAVRVPEPKREAVKAKARAASVGAY